MKVGENRQKKDSFFYYEFEEKTIQFCPQKCHSFLSPTYFLPFETQVCLSTVVPFLS